MTPEIEQAWRDVALEAWPRLRGSMVPADTFDEVRASLEAYRASEN